jgi:2-octaprenyl-6-methoxyphenol hydroxylase
MQVDVLIVGGGLTGCALALALRDSALQVALVETHAPQNSSASFDERHLGLAEVSVQALQRLGVWARITEAVGAISAIHVSSQAEFGHSYLRAQEHGVSRFGVTCPARALGAALNDAVNALPGLHLLRPATLLSLRQDEQMHQLSLESAGEQIEIRARLVVGADGSNSRIRELMQIPVHISDTGQVAIVSNVASERAHSGMAFERFTRNGPIALLPLPGGRSGVVWTQSADSAAIHMAMDDETFLDELQGQFGYRLGRLTRLGRRASHALVRHTSERTHAARVALIGNAAQTLHPIAAQGFNLGLRDALCLAQTIHDAADPGAANLLDTYAVSRAQDRARTRQFSEGLLGLTTNPALGPLRSLGMLALDAIKPLRARLVHFGMGYGRG